MDVIQKLKQGYAHLLDVPVEAFETTGLTFIETKMRELPEWANWVMPLWLLCIGSAIICSVAPQYTAVAKTIIESIKTKNLLSPKMLREAHNLIDLEGWQQREIFFYPCQQPPSFVSPYQVEKLKPGTRGDNFLKGFDGGVFVIRNQGGEIASHAGIKNKGMLNEIAVGTEPAYQRKGMGQAVVAKAVVEIITQDRVPVFIPDKLSNTVSYALARSMSFEKVGEMLFWEYEQSDWKGFPVDD